jgi:hypothetical protein
MGIGCEEKRKSVLITATSHFDFDLIYNYIRREFIAKRPAILLLVECCLILS